MILNFTFLIFYFLYYLQALVQSCIENVGELLRTNFGKELLYQVISYVMAACK